MGDSAVVVRLGETIDIGTHRKVRALSAILDQNPLPGMLEYVPAFTTVTLYYDPLRVPVRSGTLSPYQSFVAFLEDVLEQVREADAPCSRVIEIPVCYGGEFGPDLEFVAQYHDLSPEEVVDIHAGCEYVVYMIGFAPGFPYLGGMSARIATPRRSTPRLSVPPGSIGIAGNQTGVYPIETPGGWQLIGRTPLRLFRPAEEPPSLLQAGDIVRFYPIGRREFDQWEESAKR
jgi:inhibitor of KinA